MKKFVFFWRFLFIKICWHLKFLMNQIFGQRFIIFEKGRHRVNYCWNYGLSKLLLHFSEYGLDQLKNKLLKFLWNWTETNHLLVSNIFKLHEYQTFGLMEMHNMYKIWFANNIFSLWRWNKNYFSWFFKGFQLPEIAPDLRLRN